MTHTSFLPNVLLKRISASERFEKINNFFEDIYQHVNLDDLNNQQKLVYEMEYVQNWLFPMNVDPISSATDISPHVPWFLECNKEMFPYWYGKPDPRNSDFLTALQCKEGVKSTGSTSKKLFIQVNRNIL